MAQQTAVEWFWIHLEDSISKKYFDLFEQAKQMEKEQVIEGYAHGHNDGCRYMNNEKQEFEHGEQYYKDNYEQ